MRAHFNSTSVPRKKGGGIHPNCRLRVANQTFPFIYNCDGHTVAFSSTIMNILAISGSLRAASINSAFCRAAAQLAPASIRVSVFNGISALPLFNPDLEIDPPSSVLAFRDAVGEANALVIASPEYAHGISGVMKNALDWLVSFEGFINKPVAIINTSSRAHHAEASLKEILQTMSACILSEASVTIPIPRICATEAAIVASPEISEKIQTTLQVIATSLSSDYAASSTFSLN